MSLWDKEVKSQVERLKKLPRAKLLTFMVACVDHSFAANHASFLTTIKPEKLQIARSTLDQVWTPSQHQEPHSNCQATLESLYALMPGEDDPEDLIPGWYYTLAALAGIFRALMGGNLVKEVLQVADAAYQSIAEGELNRAMMGRGLCGEEITEAERASPLCREEIAFQLRCLTALEGDRSIARSKFET